jgi:NTE family protein
MPADPNALSDPTIAPAPPSDQSLNGPRPEAGTALCLSGGGYRAMLFHVGSLWRLNEFGLLPTLKRVSSVSGGSITAAVLGMNWGQLAFDSDGVAAAYVAQVVEPLRALARKTLDVPSALIGGLLPWQTVAGKVADAYRDHLFGDKTLQDLPDDGAGPRFVLNATNVQTGAVWRFSKPFMGDYLVGLVKGPRVSLAVAVGASSAFPPFLSPARLPLKQADFEPDAWAKLQQPPYTTEVVLSDGGVYDNLGLETAFKRYDTLLVSDGGAKIAPDPAPHSDWGRHAYRVLDLIDNQVRSLRKRVLLAAYQDLSGNPVTARKGAYWGIVTDIAAYQLDTALNAECPHERTLELAAIPTRLEALPDETQERLINWGYAVCDAALRKHYPPGRQPPPAFPYERGV